MRCPISGTREGRFGAAGTAAADPFRSFDIPDSGGTAHEISGPLPRERAASVGLVITLYDT
jgi:hypothetical protein